VRHSIGLIPLVYQELRVLASGRLSHEWRDNARISWSRRVIYG